jgi:nitroreductase
MNKHFDVKNTISKRVSVRNYNSNMIDEETISTIKNFIETLSNPFDVKVNYHFLNFNDTQQPQKLGTYGVIKGARQYIGASIKLEPYSLEALGYEMEVLILYLAHLGLGTCWLGGTFDRKGFSKVMNIESDEMFPAITPFGYPEGNRHITEIAMRKLINADKRKAWDQLFFLNDLNTPLRQDTAEDYAFALEMVRLGPSASNKQPWRIVIENNNYHFFEYKEPGYSQVFPYDIQRIDIGIAAAHFELAMKEVGINGQFSFDLNPFSELPLNIHYAYTWVRDSI